MLHSPHLMEKDFDRWNDLKKHINSDEILPHYHEREIWWAHVGANVGYEQDGTGPTFERPVLITRGFSPHVCVVVPLTTSTKRDRFYVSAGVVEEREAAAIVSQIRLIDTRRLINKVGMLESATFDRIRKAAALTALLFSPPLTRRRGRSHLSNHATMHSLKRK